MATQLQQQTHQPYTFQQQNQCHRPNYYSQPGFTPPRTSNTPTNVSPANSLLPPKQIYAQKSCGYVPAALRPTEMPSRLRRPDTPPRSAQSSFESGSTLLSRHSKGQPLTPTDDVTSFMAPLGKVTRVVTDEWNDELGEVTGQPTRGHWKPDSSATCCTSPVCGVTFSLFSRRHHCRRCGGIYCFAHSARSVPLDHEARFHPRGVLGRSCDNCYNDYKIWQAERKSRASSVTSANSAGTAVPPASMLHHRPEIRGSDFVRIQPGKLTHNHHLSNQESVSDWNWSTF